MDIINKWLKDNPSEFGTPRPMVECADAFRVSIQASRYVYWQPREDGAAEYAEVELGFPSGPVPDYLLEYAEDPRNPMDTVYPYTPVGEVAKLILLHGGIR